METTKQKKDEFINAGSEIKEDLLKIFNQYAKLTIADIGCCEGLHTIIYSRLFPRAEFVVFEPIKENFNKMVKNFQEYNITNRIRLLMPVAIGDRNEKVLMWRSFGDAPGVSDWETGNKSSSLLRPKLHTREHKWCEFDHKEEVDVWTLDALAEMVGFKIDFAHIDVQGAEMKVLKGGEKVFKNTKVIWLEVSNVELYAHQPLKCDISRYLNNKGMKCIKDTCNVKFGDQLWTR